MRAFILCFAILSASPALAYGRAQLLDVTALGGGDFRVEFDSQARLTDYWCAAGRYVSRKLRMPSSTRVYRLSPPPRKSGQGITFTLDAARSAGETGISTFGGKQDGSFSAGSAFSSFCYRNVDE